MRALVFDDHLHIDPQMDMPQPKQGEALLKIRRAGICNTDLELMAGLYGFSGVLGHEFVAEVITGPADLVGKRVVGEINVACDRCDFCAKGIPSQCRNRTTVGIRNHQGAFADYLALTIRNLHPVPDTVSDDAAVFVEPLAAALQILEAVHISPKYQIVVLGMGKLGMLIAQVLKLTGAKVIAVSRHQKQAALLNQWGIETADYSALDPQRANIVVDCTGSPQGIADALSLVQSRGTIVLKSTYHGQLQVDLTQVAVREINIVGSRCGPFPAALRLLENRMVDVESLIEARYQFDNALEALSFARQKGVLKVLLEF